VGTLVHVWATANTSYEYQPPTRQTLKARTPPLRPERLANSALGKARPHACQGTRDYSELAA
jgi:hypothetical protein